MKSVFVKTPGGPEVLEIREGPEPLAQAGFTIIDVRAAGLNNADLLQRRGLYPPPAGESEVLGMEVSGQANGKRVMALLSGGGYAEKVSVPSGLVMEIPSGISYELAACIPEAFLTAFLELKILADLQPAQTLLIHAGASGVGTAAIQVAKNLGARVFVTASSSEKLARCRELGADVLINYKQEDFAARVALMTEGKGVHCILDLVGAVHWAKNIESLALEGKLLLVGLGGGAKTEVDLRALLGKRIHVIGSTLRSRSLKNRVEITQKFADWALPLFARKKLLPVLDRAFAFADVVEAHRYFETGVHVGKVVLVMKS